MSERLTPTERETYRSGEWTTPKLAEAVCSRQRCSKPKRFFDWCALHARKEADKLFSKWIRTRDEVCQVCRLERSNLQCGHLVSRRYVAIRWNPANAVAICIFCHKKYTENPLAWDRWCSERLGVERWDALKLRAERGGMPDLGLVITELRTLLEEAA